MYSLPDRLAGGFESRSRLQLRQQEGRQDIGRQVAGADVHPGVLVHLAAEEAAAVGAFLADDLGALDVAWVVDQQRAALAAGEVLGLVEALGGQAPKVPR